jgi:hypothetical protein
LGVKKTKKFEENQMEENIMGNQEIPTTTLENNAQGYNTDTMEDTSVNPMIQSFVNKAKIKQTDGGDTVHTFSVSFKAQDKVSEAKVMESVLAICEDNGIDIEKFSWQKSQDNKR